MRVWHGIELNRFRVALKMSADPCNHKLFLNEQTIHEHASHTHGHEPTSLVRACMLSHRVRGNICGSDRRTIELSIVL